MSSLLLLRYRCTTIFVVFAAVFFPVTATRAVSVPAHIRMQAKAVSPVPSLNVTAQPANVTLKNGTLTVDAHNSSLDEILKDVARLGGMTIDGTAANERIFGAYGPGAPRDVLTSLLTGSGYNFVMIGDKPDGVPRKLLLTAEKAAAPSTISSSTPVAAPDRENPDEDTVDEEPPDPGAIIHVPPAGPEDPQERARQNLDRLTHMREQQQQKNTPQ